MSIGNALAVGVPRRVAALRRRASDKLRIRRDPLLEFIEVNLDEPNDLTAIYGWLTERYVSHPDEFTNIDCFITRQGSTSRFSGRQTTDEPSDMHDVVVPGKLPDIVRQTDLAYDPGIIDPHFFTVSSVGFDRYGYVSTMTMEEFAHRSI